MSLLKVKNDYQNFEVFNLFELGEGMFSYNYQKRKEVLKSFTNNIKVKHNFNIYLDFENDFDGFKVYSFKFSKKEIKKLNFLKEYLNGRKFHNQFVRSLCAKKLHNEINIWYKRVEFEMEELITVRKRLLLMKL